MAKKRNKSLEEIFKGTGVNISSTQPTSVAEQNKAIQNQGSWNNTGSKQSGGTRIVGTGGGVMPHTDTGAQRAATLSGSPYSKTGALVDAFSRGVGKTKTNNAATAFKPAPVMSKPKQTKQDRLAAVSAELDAMKNQRTQLVKDSVGKKAQTQKITELNSKIQKAKDEQKKLEKDVYGYTGNFFADTAKRIGRTLSGATQGVVGNVAETVGQIGRFGADADDARMYATTGAMINEARNPGALQRQHEAVQGRVQDAFNTSDAFAEESAKNIESAKGGLGALGKLAVDVGSEGLKLAGDMALNTIAPGSGLAAMGVRAFGSGAQEARQAGATGDQQFLYGAATAGIEMLTEKMFSASIPFKQAYGGAARVGGKTLDDAMDAVIGKVVKSPAVRALAHNFLGEGIEEQASDLLNPVAKLIYDKDAVHDTYLTAEGRQQLAEDLLRDGLVGAILGGLGATGNVVSNVAVGNRLMKNGGSGAANVLASAASFPEQSEAHKTATELIERHDKGGKITPYELGDLVHQMQEAAAHGVYPDETGGTYEVLRDAKGNWRVVHQINETAQALNEKGVDTKDAIKYAAVLDSLAQSDDMSVSQVKRKLDVFSPEVREQVEQMTGRALPEATSKADTARAIKAAFAEYRAEVEEEERLAEAERQAAAEAEEQAAIAEESDAQAAQFMEQAVAEQEQAVAQEQAQQAQQQQDEEPSLVQPLETLEEFLARKEEDAMRRYGEGLSEEERKELTKAWEQSTKNDGIRLDDGTTIGFAEFAEVMRPYLSKEEGYTVSDSKLMAAFNKFRAASAEQPISRATWEKNIAATRGDTSAQPESVTAEETAEEEPGASVLSAEEETAPVEETPAEEPAATVLSVAEESSPVEESAPKAEEKPAEKKPTQQKKTRQKKQTVIPTKAEAEAAKTATQSAETAEEVGDLAESIQNAIKVLRESGAKTQRDVFDSTGKSAKESVRLSQAYWLLQDNGLISVKSDGSFTIKNTAKKVGVKHSLSSNPNIQTNENVTLEQRLAAEFLMEHLQGKGIKGIVFDGKNLEGENGHIDKKSGIVYLNENYLDTAMAVAQTVGHEIFHAGAEGDAQLVNSMLESAKKLVDEGKLTGRNGYYAARWLKDIDAEVERRAADYRAFLEANGADAATIAEETSPEAMREEIACDLMGMVLNNQSALDTIAQTEPTLLDRIIEALDRLLGGRYSRMANYATGGEDTSFAQYGKDYANTVKELDKIAERLSKALDNYRDNRPQTSGEKHSVRSIFKAVGFDTEMDGDRVIVKDQDGKTVTHVTKSMVKKSGLGTLINLASKEGKTSWYAKTISKRDAEKQSQAVADLLNMVITAQDGEMVWRFAGSAIFSAIKTNSDGQYNTTIDFSTVCRKTRNMVTAMSEVMKRQKRGLSKDEVVELQGKILAQGGEVNCPVCYVFSRWAGIGGILENMYNFQNKYGHEYDPTVMEDGTLDWSKLDARIAELTAATKSKPALRALLLSDKAETTYQDLARELEENQSLIKQWRSDKKQYNTKALKAANAEQIAELNKNIDDKTKRNAKIKDEMKEIEKLGSPELAWLKKVRRDENYWKAVKDSKGNLVGGGYVEESDVLFDLDAGDKFAERYPLAWKYRTGRGPSAGKAIQPYADMRMGDLILGPGNNSANGNTTFETVGEELTPEQEKAFRAARKRTMAQNLIGGQRFQSTSDFRYDYGLDYLQTFLEAQALGSTMQSYTKVLEFVTLAASVGGDVNISVMPLGKGYNSETGQLEFSDVTGVNIDDAIRLSQKYDSAQIILVGINDEHIRKALDDNGGDGGEYIGFVIPYHASGASINSFIASQLANITKHTETNDTFNQGDYNDYAPVQTDSVKSEVQRDDPNLEAIRQNPMNPKFKGNVSEAKRNALMQQYHRELRTAILTGKLSTKPKTQATTTEANRVLEAAQEYLDSLESVDITGRSFEDLREVERRALEGDADAIREYESWSMGLLKDLNAKMQNYGLVEEDGSIDRVYLSGQQAHAVMPHEYWNQNTTRANAYINGLIFRSYCYNLGLYPRFTGIKSDGKRARTTRPMLDADGNPMLDAKGQPVMEHYEYGDFSDEPGYWKTLIDRPMYDNRGVYRSQNPVNATNVSVKSLQPVDGETFTDDLALRAANDYLADKGIKHSLPTDTKQMDEEYMAAVESGDTAGAQEMVDEAARRAGYDIRAYHGTKADFTAFDKSRFGKNYGGFLQYGDGFYFALNNQSAERWAGKAKSDGEPRVMPVFLSSQRMLNVNDPVDSPAAAEYLKSIGTDKADINWYLTTGYRFIEAVKYREGQDGIQKVLESLGYDGIADTLSSEHGQYVVFNPEQVKSSDPVTYDNDGNIIPLSERFRADRAGEDAWKNRDIRYSLHTNIEWNDGEIPDTDNTGAKLTPEQVAFFSRGGLVDSYGNLVRVYRMEKYGGATTARLHRHKHGVLYFTTDPDIARSYMQGETSEPPVFKSAAEAVDYFNRIDPENSYSVGDDGVSVRRVEKATGELDWVWRYQDESELVDNIRADVMNAYTTGGIGEPEIISGYVRMTNPKYVNADFSNWSGILHPDLKGQYRKDVRLLLSDLDEAIKFLSDEAKKVENQSNGDIPLENLKELLGYYLGDKFSIEENDNGFDLRLTYDWSKNNSDEVSATVEFPEYLFPGGTAGLTVKALGDMARTLSLRVRRSTDEIAELARSEGYDGVIIENTSDVGGNADVETGQIADDIILVRDSIDAGQFKFADNTKPTYDRDFRYSIAPARDLYQTEFDFSQPITTDEFREKIKQENDTARYFPKGLSPEFMKAITRKDLFAKPKLYRGIDAAEFDFIMENGFIKSNGSYNFSNQQDQTLADEDAGYALSYATGFAPREIADRHYKDGLPSYLIEFVNAPDLNVAKNDVQESYTYGNIDQKYITRVFEIMYDPESGKDMIQDVTDDIRAMRPELGSGLDGLSHGLPMFYRDKTTGTILYAVQGADGYETGGYISEKHPGMVIQYEDIGKYFKPDMVQEYFGISGNEADLEPMVIGKNGELATASDSNANTPVSAFTEKGRKYSVRGQVPEFDAWFDQYMAKMQEQDRAKYLQDNPPVQRRSQTHSTDHLLTDDEKKKTGRTPDKITHTVVKDKAMREMVDYRLDADEVGEKRRLSRKDKRWDAADTATMEELIKREVEKARETGDFLESQRLLRMHDRQMSDWGLTGHVANEFANSAIGIVSDATETLGESVEQEPRNQKKKATAQKVTESVGNAGRAAAKQVRKEMGKAAGESDGKPTIPDKKTFEKSKQRKGKKAVEIEGNMVGEPFTFEYSDAVGTAIGRSMMSALNQKQRSKTFLEEMQSHIKRFASEKMPKRGSKAPTTPTELLREYVQNQRFYEEAWANAQDEVRRQLEKKGIEEIPEELEGFLGGWYGVDANGNPQNKILRAAIAHSALSSKETADKIRKQAALGSRNIADIIANDLIKETGAKGEIAWTIKKAAQFYVDDVLAKPVATKDGKVSYDAEQQTKVLDNMVASALAEIGKAIDSKKGPSSMQRLGSTSAAFKADIRDAVIATLTLQYAVSEEDAENVARIVSDRFDVLLKEGMNKRLANMFKDREAPSAQAKKAFIDRVVELTNLGAMESADYHDAAVAKLLGGYETRRGVTTDEVLKQVYDYATRLDDIPKGDTKALKQIVSDLNAERWTGGMAKGNEIHKTLQKIINYVASQPDGADFLRDLAAAQIRGIANDNARISAVDAINAERYLAMLSKLTTVARNIVGNTAFDLVETISNNTATTPIDALMYLRTKRRTATIDKSYLNKAKRQGAADGFLRSVIEIALDAPIDDGTDKWEMRNGRAFKMAKANNPNAVKKTANVAENLMSTWEKWQKYLLVATDEFAKGGTRAERQRQLDVLRSKGLLGEDELLEDADEVARERTFQNQGKMTKIMGGLRNVGNVIGFNDSHGNRVGLGTALMPFANVPANIAGQALNYSPLGLLKGAIEVEEVMRKGKRATAEEQARAARDFGRGVNGTALIAMFMAAALKGLLKVSGNSGDRDRDALERDEGLTGTQFNLSAFIRWLKGESTERQKGDTLMNVGGLEPINAPMAFGALLADSYAEDGTWLSKLANASFESVMQTLKDLPAMSQLSSIADAYKYSDEKKTEENPNGGPAKQFMDAAAQGFSDIATSGVPNILSGVAQTLDQGRYRTPQTSDKRGLDAVPENILNSFKMKIPGLRNTLPDALDSYGNPRQTTATPFQNALNSNLLPFAINSFQPNPVSEELFRLKDAGAKVTLPARNPIKSVNTKDGQKKTLTAEEQRQYQETEGGLKYDTMLEAMNSKAYGKQDTEFQAKVWADVASYANAKGKLAVGGKAEVPTWSEKGSGSIANRAINHAFYQRMNDVLPEDGVTTGRKMQELLKYANGDDQLARDLFAQLLDNNQSRGTLKKIDYLHKSSDQGGGGGYSYEQIAKFYNAKNEKSKEFGLNKNGEPKSRTKDKLIEWATQNGFTRDQALWLYKVFNGDVDIP